MLRKSLLEETCTKIVSVCNRHSFKDGICIHTPLLKLCLQNQENLPLSNNLLSLYSKCYGIEYAHHFFDEMPYRDVVSWTSILSSLVKHERHEEALRFFDFMRVSGEYPNEFTLSNVLTSCSTLGNLGYGAKVQAFAIKHGFGSNHVLGNSLIELYSKWGLLEEAVEVFNGMSNRDTVSWTTMISSLVESGNPVQGLRFFVRMIEKSVPPNEYTFVKLLDACGSLGIVYGMLVHAQLIVWGVRLNLVLKTALVGMYANLQNMKDALKVMNRTSEQDAQLWTTLIIGFTRNLNFREAVRAFLQMVKNGIVPSSYSYAGILSACSSNEALGFGKQIHTRLIMSGLENDTSVGNSLLHFYAKCSNSTKYVRDVFKGINFPNVVSWTTLIAGLAAHCCEDECFRAFLDMQLAGHQPNSFTLSHILQACGTAQSTTKIHALIVKTNAEHDVNVGNALVDAYSSLRMVDEAIRFVKGMRHRNLIAYTILVSRLNQAGCHRVTLDFLSHMHRNDYLKLDGFIVSSFLSASANLGVIETGKQLHCYSIKSGFGKWISVLNGLIDLYGKCCNIRDAETVFGEIPNPDIVSWNSLMYGFVYNRHIKSALSTLEDMRLAGGKPDSITLQTVLFACDRGGLVDMGVEYFRSLRELYHIKPQLHHYELLIDLLVKDGRLDEAVGVMRSMPFSPNPLIYKKMLRACKLQGKVFLGEEMARLGIDLDPSDVEFYALLACMYDEAGKCELGDSVRNIVKEGGFSSKRSVG